MKFLFAGKFFRGSFALFEHESTARAEEVLSLLGGDFEVVDDVDDDDEECDGDCPCGKKSFGFRSTE